MCRLAGLSSGPVLPWAPAQSHGPRCGARAGAGLPGRLRPRRRHPHARQSARMATREHTAVTSLLGLRLTLASRASTWASSSLTFPLRPSLTACTRGRCSHLSSAHRSSAFCRRPAGRRRPPPRATPPRTHAIHAGSLPFILSVFSGTSCSLGDLQRWQLTCFSLVEFTGPCVLDVCAHTVPSSGVGLSVQPDTCHSTAFLLSGVSRYPGVSCPSPGVGCFQGPLAPRAQPGLGSTWSLGCGYF